MSLRAVPFMKLMLESSNFVVNSCSTELEAQIKVDALCEAPESEHARMEQSGPSASAMLREESLISQAGRACLEVMLFKYICEHDKLSSKVVTALLEAWGTCTVGQLMTEAKRLGVYLTDTDFIHQIYQSEILRFHNFSPEKILQIWNGMAASQQWDSVSFECRLVGNLDESSDSSAPKNEGEPSVELDGVDLSGSQAMRQECAHGSGGKHKRRRIKRSLSSPSSSSQKVASALSPNSVGSPPSSSSFSDLKQEAEGMEPDGQSLEAFSEGEGEGEGDDDGNSDHDANDYDKYNDIGRVNRKKWTKAEDQQLAMAFDRCKHISPLPWKRIASIVGTRNRAQCLHRWRKSLNPSMKKGKFSKEEDALLVDAVRKLGTCNWKHVKLLVPGRTDVQCRERYVNTLAPGLKKGIEWSAEEKATLLANVKEHGSSWAVVARSLPGRTDCMCRKQYLKLTRDDTRDSGEKTSSSNKVPVHILGLPDAPGTRGGVRMEGGVKAVGAMEVLLDDVPAPVEGEEEKEKEKEKE